MSSILKEFASDKEAMEILKNPGRLKEVLYILQETTDAYMAEAQTKINDKRRSVQEQAQEALDFAAAVIEAERKIRELELYASIKLKERGMNIITDA